MPGQFAVVAFTIFLFSCTLGTATQFVHEWTGLWIDWGWWSRRVFAISVASTALTLLVTLAAFGTPRSRRVHNSIVWNAVALTLHLLILASCLSAAFMVRGFHRGPAD